MGRDAVGMCVGDTSFGSLDGHFSLDGKWRVAWVDLVVA